MGDTLNQLIRGPAATFNAGGAVQVNPLAAITAGNQAAEAEYRVRGLQANQALGNILQQSTGPDGVVDYGKANALAAQAGPIVQMGMRGALESNAQLNGAQVSQAKNLHDFVGSLAASGVQDTSDENWDNIKAMAVNSKLPPGALTEIDRIRALPENQRAGAALPHVISNQDALTRLHVATGGEPGSVNQGGGTQFFKRNLITGEPTPAGVPIPNTLSPAERTEIVQMPDLRKTLPDGSPNPEFMQKKPFTREEQLGQLGYTVTPDGRVVKTGEPGGQLGTGRYPLPPALQGPGGGAQPPQPTQPPANAQPPGTPVPPGQPGVNPNAPVQIPPPTSPYANRPASAASPGDESQAQAAGGKFDAEATAGTNAQGQQAILANMLGDTKQFMPGPYANSIAAVRARLAPVFGADEKALAAHDSFEKLAAQLALQQAGSVGAGSDSRFSVTQAANPHGGISPASIDLILRQLQGNSDYIQARQKLAQQWPAKSDYNGFVDSTRPLDPRVFQYERMTDGQRKDWFTAMDPKDQKAFMQAHKWAEGNKLIPGG